MLLKALRDRASSQVSALISTPNTCRCFSSFCVARVSESCRLGLLRTLRTVADPGSGSRRVTGGACRKQRTLIIVAERLSYRPLGLVVGGRPIANDVHVIAIGGRFLIPRDEIHGGFRVLGPTPHHHALTPRVGGKRLCRAIQRPPTHGALAIGSPGPRVSPPLDTSAGEC